MRVQITGVQNRLSEWEVEIVETPDGDDKLPENVNGFGFEVPEGTVCGGFTVVARNGEVRELDWTALDREKTPKKTPKGM